MDVSLFLAGRFKDEARHQQRLSDMNARCDALFGGAIQNHFKVEHHATGHLHTSLLPQSILTFDPTLVLPYWNLCVIRFPGHKHGYAA